MFFIILIALFFNFSITDLSAKKLPYKAIKGGTLANQKLILDTKVLVAANVAIKGCMKLETFSMLIKQMPQGKKGSRLWKEIWVVRGCGKKYPIEIHFLESGTGVTMILKNKMT
jgi:hypothetical protein